MKSVNAKRFRPADKSNQPSTDYAQKEWKEMPLTRMGTEAEDGKKCMSGWSKIALFLTIIIVGLYFCLNRYTFSQWKNVFEPVAPSPESEKRITDPAQKKLNDSSRNVLGHEEYNFRKVVFADVFNLTILHLDQAQVVDRQLHISEKNKPQYDKIIGARKHKFVPFNSKFKNDIAIPSWAKRGTQLMKEDIKCEKTFKEVAFFNSACVPQNCFAANTWHQQMNVIEPLIIQLERAGWPEERILFINRPSHRQWSSRGVLWSVVIELFNGKVVED